MAELTVRIKPDDIVERVIDEATYKGKTIREWADLLTNPKTNADRIRAMSDEELVDWICGICPTSVPFDCDHGCKICWLDWLQQEVDSDPT